MKVILTRDVRGVGRAHEEVSAADGYALNYLIPKKLAVPATPAAMQNATLRRKQAEDRRALDKALLAEQFGALAEANIVVRAKANEKGHLYDAVGEPEIRTAVKEQTRVELPAGVIRLERPLKEIGTFTVPVVSGEIFGSFSVNVEAEA